MTPDEHREVFRDGWNAAIDQAALLLEKHHVGHWGDEVRKLAERGPEGEGRVEPQICDGFHAATCPHQTQCEIEGECIQRMKPQTT